MNKPEVSSTYRLFSIIAPIFLGALALYFISVAIYSLCHMSSTRVKLHGIGLVWAWLAMIASLFTIFSPFIPSLENRPYASQLILGISAFVGYLMLICKKRAGVFVVLLGVGLMLLPQLLNSVNWMMTPNSEQGIQLLISTLLGALNPLFAYLATRAGEVLPEKE